MSGDEWPEISMDDWIVVPHWDKFQHYKNREPPWIKIYAKLLHKPEYLRLTLASRGLLTTIWLAYSQAAGRLQVCDIATVSRRQRDFYPQLVSLNHAGFIEVSASKPLAQEVEVEKESSLNPLTAQARRRRLEEEAWNVSLEWQGGPSELFEERLDDLEAKLRARLSYTLRSRLWDAARERTLPPSVDLLRRMDDV